MPFRYESQSGVQLDEPSEEDLNQVLSRLDGVDNSYASLTAPDGSYVQVGGGPTDFTVELRDTGQDGAFRQLKAAIPKGNPQERRLNIGGASVSVRSDQILNLATVRKIFRNTSPICNDVRRLSGIALAGDR